MFISLNLKAQYIVVLLVPKHDSKENLKYQFCL